MALLLLVGATATALPAVASAAVESPAHWAEGGTRLANGVKKAITFSGKLRVNWELGSIECPVSGTDTIENVKTAGKKGETSARGSVTEFTFNTPCVTGGLLAGCTVENMHASSLPWQTPGYIDSAGKRRLELQGIEFENQFKSGCIISVPITFGPGTLDAFLTPVVSGGITHIEFTAASGTLATTPNIGSISLSGAVGVTPSAKYELVPGS